MGLFDKKFCDFCGKKIGLLGNKKLEDGNMCRECASRLSPWFSERRHSTKADIQAQLDYREENREKVAAFNATRTIGEYYKLMVDEEQKKFMVTNAYDLEKANPDVLDYSQARGCELNIEETRIEKKRQNSDGSYVSYNPPRFNYSYNFQVRILVDHPFFDKIEYSLSNGPVDNGEQPASPNSGWRTSRNEFKIFKTSGYYDFLEMGNEIKALIDGMVSGGGEDQPAASVLMAVTCPKCGASTIPDAFGCCEYCGGAIYG